MSIDSMSLVGEVLYSWPVIQGVVSLSKGSEGCVALLKQTDGILHEIDHSLPSPLLTLSERDVVVYCASTYPQLVELSDSSYRLYLYTRGLGGMTNEEQKNAARGMGIPDQSDYTISAAIQRNLENAPGNLYTNVQVETCMHHFAANEHIQYYVPTRHITLQVNFFDSVGNFFEKLFHYVLTSHPDVDTVRRYQRGIIHSAISDTILGIRHEHAQYQHIINAFKRNSTIDLWISCNVEYLEIKVKESLKQDGRCIIL